MRERPIDPLRLDVRAFAQDEGRLEGEWPQAGFPRLADVLEPADDRAPVRWSAAGQLVQRAADRIPAVHLTAGTTLVLQCQRCLQAVDWPVTVDTRFRFVATEDEAERLDAESDDDVLALPRELDLHALLEDELLLALPLVPRHAACTPPLTAAADGSDNADADQPAEHPFAALAALRKRGG